MNINISMCVSINISMNLFELTVDTTKTTLVDATRTLNPLYIVG